ncbi:uncharacterized protein LOC132613142 [Lycium barbarum]|uniref:uncharacterized protein LOC132613142 n=1 Tax=Lycium barbarum TaxID=112863 RepID=UPI00293F2162|nr:uncharacterized protein LOC132613142 [Lycium barbarum]
MGLLENKIKSNKIAEVASIMFGGWQYVTNLESRYNGRVWLVWRLDFYTVVPLASSSQVITCEILYIPLQLKYIMSIVYAYNTKEAWLNNMPPCTAVNLPEGISDHCPIKLTLTGQNTRRKRAFQYFNVWGQHPSFMNTVRKGWDININGCSMWKLVRRLKLLKSDLKKLNSQFFRNIVTQSNDDREELFIAQRALQTDPLNLVLQQEEKEKLAKFRQSSYLAEMFLQQQSKVTWIKLGDDNTQYFYSVIKHRRLKQVTTQLRDDLGNWHSNNEEIASLFEQQVLLLQPYTGKEVKTTVFQIDSNKSPGPDGYGSGFFKSAWEIVGEDVVTAVLEFFTNGKLLKQLNATNIALIPKISSPEQASQFRPISCCNVLYKCISKVICQKTEGSNTNNSSRKPISICAGQVHATQCSYMS